MSYFCTKLVTAVNISKKYFLLFCTVCLLAAVDLLAGGLNYGELTQTILLELRLPRMLCAVLAGIALAQGGMQMQAIFRNPLADPHVLGISSGAALGASLAAAGLLTGAAASGGWTLAAAAFAGAILAGVGVVAVSGRFQGVATLLIFGLLLGFIFSAITTLIQYFGSEESLKLYHSWVSGSFASCSGQGLIYIGFSAVIGISIAATNLKGMDVILFGDEFAAAAGARVPVIRLKALLSCCLMTATVTAFCGPIGFVGIIAPHIAKAVFGTSVHSKLMLPVALTGAGITLLADIIAQLFSTPVPVGATIALVGVPVIMFILLGKKLW